MNGVHPFRMIPIHPNLREINLSGRIRESNREAMGRYVLHI